MRLGLSEPGGRALLHHDKSELRNIVLAALERASLEDAPDLSALDLVELVVRHAVAVEEDALRRRPVLFLPRRYGG